MGQTPRKSVWESRSRIGNQAATKRLTAFENHFLYQFMAFRAMSSLPFDPLAFLGAVKLGFTCAAVPQSPFGFIVMRRTIVI